MFCKECGKEVNDKAVVCPSCGCMLNTEENLVSTSQEKKKGISILCLVGFILSLVSLLLALYGTVAIAGLVLSIIGIVKCSKNNLRLKGLGIAGIVVAAASLVYTTYVIIAAATILSML